MHRFEPTRLLPLLCVLASCTLACAQTTTPAEQAFVAATRDKPLILRGFSADTLISWTAGSSGKLVLGKPRVRGLAVLRPSALTFSPGHIVLSGPQFILVHREDAPALFLTGETATLVINFDPADELTLLPTLASTLFYPTVHDATADLPAKLHDIIPVELDAEGRVTKRGIALIQQHDPEDDDCTAHSTPAEDFYLAGITPPHLIKSQTPVFTPEAMRAHGSINVPVWLHFDINTAGVPENIWLLQPGPFRLSAQALKAAREYRFAPATCHSHPISSALTLMVNFQR